MTVATQQTPSSTTILDHARAARLSREIAEAVILFAPAMAGREKRDEYI